MARRVNQRSAFEVVVQNGQTPYVPIILHIPGELPKDGIAILDTGSAFTLVRSDKYAITKAKKVTGPANISGIVGKAATTDGHEINVVLTMLRDGKVHALSRTTTVWGVANLLEGTKADVLLGCDFLAHATMQFRGGEPDGQDHGVMFSPKNGRGWRLDGSLI